MKFLTCNLIQVSITEVPNGTKLAKEEKIAQGDEALRVLECVTTRTQFINELIEVGKSCLYFSLKGYK